MLAGAAGEPEDHEPPPAEVITWGLLAGHGRFTRVEVAEQARMGIEETRRLWWALGSPKSATSSGRSSAPTSPP